MENKDKKEYGMLVAKKAERLVTALYLVTDLINDEEPIKNNLRKISLNLLSSMNSLAQLQVKDSITEFKISLKSVTEILSLLQVAKTTGLLSDMNGTILIDGFRSMQIVLEKKQPILTKEMLVVENEESLHTGGHFTQTLNTTSYDVLTPLSIAREKREDAHIHNERKTNDSNLDVRDRGYFKETENKQETDKINAQRNVFKRTESGNTVKDKNMSFTTSFQMRKESRKEQILGLFVRGVELSIKDISSRIKGCSEKTIQRELNALLFAHKIERIGEKRWSKYVLK